jgi:ribosome-associated translation inhibitor RaiA
VREKMQIQVGQTVYLEPVSDARSKEIIETKVVKIGRKYFKVENKRSKFDIGEMRDISDYGYGSNWKVYLSKQEIEDKNEKNSIYRSMRELFSYGCNDLSLEQLRQMQKIATQFEK